MPLFFSSLGLMTGFTFIFPWLGILTLPIALLVIGSIFTGDLTFIDDEIPETQKEEE